MYRSKGADLLYTNVKRARFDGADLNGTLLHSAGIAEAILDGAILSETHRAQTLCVAEADVVAETGEVKYREPG